MSKVRIKISKEIIAEFCKSNDIKKLAFYGSVIKEAFGPHCDVDVLVEFKPGRVPGLFRMAHIERELSDLLGRKVDLRTPQDLSRYFRDEVIESAEEQYVEK